MHNPDLIPDWLITVLILILIIITIYLIAIQFTVRSNATPDCLQFCRPCGAKPASLFHTHISVYIMFLQHWILLFLHLFFIL